jgi:hypothetical protein
MLDEKVAARFWALVDKSAGEDVCWFPKCRLHWDRTSPSFQTACVFPLKGRNYPMHKVAYVLAGGIVPDGMIVRHRCGWACCVNPAHLIAGTYQQNMWDRYAREWARIEPGELATYEDVPGYVPAKVR